MENKWQKRILAVAIAIDTMDEIANGESHTTNTSIRIVLDYFNLLLVCYFLARIYMLLRLIVIVADSRLALLLPLLLLYQTNAEINKCNKRFTTDSGSKRLAAVPL